MNRVAPFVQDFQFRDYDPDQLREVIDGADLDHTILEPTNCSADVRQWSWNDISINSGYYSFPVFVRGRFAPGRLCIGISRGRHEPTWVNGVHLDLSSLQVYAEDSEMYYRAGPSTDWAAITISRELLQEAALKHMGFEISLPLQGMKNYTIPHQQVDRLMDLIRAGKSRSGNLTLDAGMRREQILRTCVEALGIGEHGDFEKANQNRQHRAKIIRRADRVIQSLIQNGEPYSSVTLCQSLGLSERNLQLHFKDALGLSPKKWYRHIALNQVRSSLLRSDPKPGIIARVAMDHNFDHLGRFSRSYQQLFGESPSETVRQRALSLSRTN